MLSVLIIDDDVDSLQALKIGLESDKYGIHIATSLKEAMKAVKSVDVDVVVTDLKLKDGSGLEILYFIQEKFPQIAVIIITAYASVESAVESIRGGAYEYLVKPFRLTELKRLLDRLNETISLRKENENLKQRLFQEISAPQLVGASRKFKEVVEFVKQIAPSRSTVLITGETGTGKEGTAYAIHHMSPRQGKPFVKINCGAIPENLLEAELFGYEKGAFTGATRLKKGKIELAQEGTLFLDEIGDLNPAMQVKLLRFLAS